MPNLKMALDPTFPKELEKAVEEKHFVSIEG